MLLFCSTLAFAQPVPAPPAQRIKVTGHVLNSLSGEPIARALVTEQSRGGRFALTDDNGSFTFEEISSDIIVLTAQKPGYYDSTTSSQARNVSVKVAQNVVLKLTPAATIVGRVIGNDEEPVESAQVQLYSQVNMEGRKRWTHSNATETDEEGHFRFHDLRAGSYLVSIGPFQNRGVMAGDSYASIYYPNAPDRRSAAPIQVTAGQQAKINVHVRPVQVFNISGNVVGADVDAVNFRIADLSGAPVNIPGGMNPRTHRFLIPGIPRGSYVISLTGYQRIRQPVAFAQPPQTLHGRLVLTVTADRNDLVVPLQPELVIPIEIRREDVVPPDTTPPTGLVIMGGSRVVGVVQTNVSLRARSLDNEDMEAYSTFEGTPGQGRLVMKGLDTGRYQITANAFGNYYIASATLAGTDILSQPLVIPDTPPSDPIEIVLRNDVAKVRITLSASANPARIVAVPEHGPNPKPMVGACDAERNCFIPESLAPGNYAFYAFDNLENIEYANPKALEAYSSRASHVTLSAGQTSDVTLSVIKTEP